MYHLHKIQEAFLSLLGMKLINVQNKAFKHLKPMLQW